MSMAGLIAMQQAQHQMHMVQSTMMSMAQAQMTHETNLLNAASKGQDARQKIMTDAAISKQATTQQIGDTVSQKL